MRKHQTGPWYRHRHSRQLVLPNILLDLENVPGIRSLAYVEGKDRIVGLVGSDYGKSSELHVLGKRGIAFIEPGSLSAESVDASRMVQEIMRNYGIGAYLGNREEFTRRIPGEYRV